MRIREDKGEPSARRGQLRRARASAQAQSRPPKLPHMTLAAFYVLVSRVQRFDGLRLLCHDPKGLEKVSYLQHDAYLYAWECGYDAEARWNDDLAKVALGKIRAKRDAERARKAEVAKAKATREREAKKLSLIHI